MHNIHSHALLCNERNTTVCCKFTQLHCYQILLKLFNNWLSYCENQKGDLFWNTVYIRWTCLCYLSFFSKIKFLLLFFFCVRVITWCKKYFNWYTQLNACWYCCLQDSAVSTVRQAVTSRASSLQTDTTRTIACTSTIAVNIHHVNSALE